MKRDRAKIVVMVAIEIGVFAHSRKKVQSTIYHVFESIFGECTLKITDISLIYHRAVLREVPSNPWPPHNCLLYPAKLSFLRHFGVNLHPNFWIGLFWGDMQKGQNQFIARLFGLAAQAGMRSICLTLPTCLLPGLFATEPGGLGTIDIWMDFPCRRLSCIIKKRWRLSGTDIFCNRTPLYDRK